MRYIIIIFIFLFACEHTLVKTYIVDNAYTITVKTERGGIELVPIIKAYDGVSNEIIVVDEKIFTTIDIGDTVYVRNNNVFKVEKKK